MRDTTVRAEIYPRTVTRKSRAESPDNASGALLPIGDAYGGEWPREQFRKHGIQYQISELNRSGLYLELLPLTNSASIELLDNARLINQLAGLERRVGPSGKDSVNHRPGGHDDVANAAAGAVVYATRSNDFATLPADFQ